MPRLRKQRRKQKYQYHVNRKRLNEKLTKLPEIQCSAIKKAWDKKKSATTNLQTMGLKADLNKMIADPRRRKKTADILDMPITKELTGESDNETDTSDVEMLENGHVAKELEKEAKDGYEAKKLRKHPMPRQLYKDLCSFIDRFGEDYKAMARDHMNFDQKTALQFRMHVNRLKKTPSQWIPYLRGRGLLEGCDGPILPKQ